MSDQWFSIVEYARQFSISDMTVRRRIKNGRLKAVLKDGKYYIPVSGADEYRTNAAVAANEPARPHLTKSSKRDELVVLKGAKSGTKIYENHSRGSANWGHSEALNPKDNFIMEEQTKRHDGTYAEKGFDKEALVRFCEDALKRSEKVEKATEEKYENKLVSLQMELRAVQIENKNLKQQIEDLQLLVRLFESKK